MAEKPATPPSSPSPAFVQGDRIDLVPMNLDHIALYSVWWNNAAVRRYGRSVFPETTEEIKKEFTMDTSKREEVFFEIWLKAEKRPVGSVGFHHIHWANRNAMIGLSIGEESSWGKGYATEAVRLLLQYGFEELNFHKISAHIFSPNIGSWKAAEKAGMTREAVFREEMFIDGQYADDFIYCIFDRDYFSTKSKKSNGKK
jgi:ribosomal-protein-alanine N-acetyltransferase